MNVNTVSLEYTKALHVYAEYRLSASHGLMKSRLLDFCPFENTTAILRHTARQLIRVKFVPALKRLSNMPRRLMEWRSNCTILDLGTGWR
jgi:hypothetical protein